MGWISDEQQLILAQRIHFLYHSFPFHFIYLNGKCSQDNSAKNGISEDAIEDVPLAVDFAGVDLVEELHHDKGVEDDGVVLRRRGVKRGIPPTVNLEHFLTWA